MIYPLTKIFMTLPHSNAPKEILMLNLERPQRIEEMDVDAIEAELDARGYEAPARWFFYQLPEKRAYLKKARNNEVPQSPNKSGKVAFDLTNTFQDAANRTLEEK